MGINNFTRNGRRDKWNGTIEQTSGTSVAETLKRSTEGRPLQKACTVAKPKTSEAPGFLHRALTLPQGKDPLHSRCFRLSFYVR